MINGDIWIFGYGSLMWRPGFAYKEVRNARIFGYHRALCVYSITYRGSPDAPGLVMGLDRGGSCCGRAFLVDADDAQNAVDYLDARELVTGVYMPKFLKTRLDDGRLTDAYAYIARPEHRQYAGGISLDKTVAIISTAHGKEGPSLQYLENTVDKLDEFGITDGPLHRILEKALFLSLTTST